MMDAEAFLSGSTCSRPLPRFPAVAKCSTIGVVPIELFEKNVCPVAIRP